MRHYVVCVCVRAYTYMHVLCEYSMFYDFSFVCRCWVMNMIYSSVQTSTQTTTITGFASRCVRQLSAVKTGTYPCTTSTGAARNVHIRIGTCVLSSCKIDLKIMMQTTENSPSILEAHCCVSNRG